MVKEISKLPVQQRLEIVAAVWDSILDEDAAQIPITPAQRTLLQDRLRQSDADPTSARPLADVLDEIEAAL